MPPGQALFREFSAGPGNIVFSPYSIGTAMAMALAGARGETEREMAAVLQHSLARAQINDANASALATLNGYDKSEVAADLSAWPCSSQGERCEGKPTAGGGCAFPASPNRRHVRGDAAVSAVGQAPGRQCADAGRR